MSRMFKGASSFSGDVSGWDTSSVSDMSRMFEGASTFNGYISGWDTASVLDMSSMFQGASSFNQPIGNWDTSSVTDMSFMFNSASSFSQCVPDSFIRGISTSMFVGSNGTSGPCSQTQAPSVGQQAPSGGQGGSTGQGSLGAYAGPTISSIDKKIAQAGSLVVLFGTKLDLVTSVTIDGIAIAMTTQSSTSLTLQLSALMTLGVKDLVLVSSFGVLTAAALFRVIAADTPAIAPAAKKLSIGSFKGFTAIYAKGYQGQRLSALIAGKWLKVDSITKSFQRVIRKTGSNKTIGVKIFIDRKLERELRITTK
jgi:surface protein